MSAVEYDKKKIKKRMNYYSVLGISNIATDEEIQKAFDEMSRRHNSHRASEISFDGSNSRLALINEAYQALSHPETRSKYDQELNLVLSLDKSSGEGSLISFAQLKSFGRYLRFTLILVSLLFLIFVISYFTFIEIKNPNTRIKGLEDGLLLFSLVSFFVLIISYYKDIPSRMRAWFRVLSICILAFCITVAVGLFAIPSVFSF